MGKLSKEQAEFAKAMTIKQRRVLWALAIYQAGWFMSASERADPELYELFKHKLVMCGHAVIGGGLPTWGLTEAGRRIADRQFKRDLG